MEGAYNRVLSAWQTVPHRTYVYYMDLLAKTVRDEIAGCSEKAYAKEHPDWEVRNGCVFFQKAKEATPCKEIPSLQLIS
ncbi:hypothetical protein EJ110_NYTH44183 [Nymphaea thermarum]|nr:hypothetical protein EJ110_NYTH44183 [Nymphaea thermarum]